MIKLIDRYMVRETIGPFGVGVAGFVLIEIGTVIYGLIDLIVQTHTPLLLVVELLAFRLPKLLAYALPIATLFGVSLAVNRLARDGEITAVRMAGVPLHRLLVPLAVVGIVVSVATFEIGDRVAPWSDRQFDRVWSTMLLTQPLPDVRPDVFFSADGRQFYVRLVEKTGTGKVLLHDLVMYEPELRGYPVITTCRLATTDGQHWRLKHAIQIYLGKDGRWSAEVAVREMDLNFQQPIQDMLAGQLSLDEMSSSQLAGESQAFHAGHVSVPAMDTELYCRFSLPFSSLVLALISAPLSIRFARSGGFTGVLLSIVLFFFYYNTYFLTNHLGSNGAIPPLIAAWLPDVLFGAIGLALIRLEE